MEKLLLRPAETAESPRNRPLACIRAHRIGGAALRANWKECPCADGIASRVGRIASGRSTRGTSRGRVTERSDLADRGAWNTTWAGEDVSTQKKTRSPKRASDRYPQDSENDSRSKPESRGRVLFVPERRSETYEELRLRNESLGDEYVVARYIRPRSIALVVGRSGEGKTPLVYQLGMSVAAGIPFLGMPTNQGLVILFDYENGSVQIQALMESLLQHLGLPNVPSSFRIWTPSADDARGPLQVILEERPALAIIDSLSAWDPECEEKNAKATRAMGMLRAIANEAGCSIVAVHHPRKLSANTRSRPEPLETCIPRDWIQVCTRGVSALINASDNRIGVDVCSHEEEGITVAGYARSDGDLPKMCLRRACDDSGKPLGYVRLRGAELLSSPDRQFLARLGDKFFFREAMYAWGKGPQSTRNLLLRLISANVVRQRVPRGPYRKVTEETEEGDN